MNPSSMKSCIAAGILVCLSGCCSLKLSQAAYDYRVDVVEFVQPVEPPRSNLQAHLDRYAAEGWILDHLVQRGGEGSWVVVMKRPKGQQ